MSGQINMRMAMARLGLQWWRRLRRTEILVQDIPLLIIWKYYNEGASIKIYSIRIGIGESERQAFGFREPIWGPDIQELCAGLMPRIKLAIIIWDLERKVKRDKYHKEPLVLGWDDYTNHPNHDIWL